MLTKFASLLPSAPNIGKTRIEHPRICYFRRAFGVIDAWTFFSFRCRSPYRPGSAKRSEERGKSSRGNSITTPKAAPYFQMRGSTRSVPTGSSAPGRRLSAYVGTVSHDSRSSLLDRPAARFLFFARRENGGLAPRRSRTPPRRPQTAHSPPSRPRGPATPVPARRRTPSATLEEKGPRPRAAQRPIVPRPLGALAPPPEGHFL